MVAEQPTEPQGRADARPMQVALIAVGDAPSHTAVREALEREVIEIDVFGCDILDDDPPFDSGVVLLWVGAGADASVFEGVVRWAARDEHRIAVLGCAPLGTVDDSVAGLAAGMDDFVAGRCSPRELAGRIRALVRRVKRPSTRNSRRMRYGPLTLDAYGHELWVYGRRVRLTATEMSVIRALIAARGRALSRAEILDLAWGEQNLEVGERAVDNVVLRLRRKIGKHGLIETVRGVGFRLA